MRSLLFLGGRILGPVAAYVSAHLHQTWDETPTPAPDLSLVSGSFALDGTLRKSDKDTMTNLS
jgi:hypothetical protein